MYLADSSRLPTVHLLHDNVVYLGFTIIQSRISVSYSHPGPYYLFLEIIKVNREGMFPQGAMTQKARMR